MTMRSSDLGVIVATAYTCVCDMDCGMCAEWFCAVAPSCWSVAVVASLCWCRDLCLRPSREGCCRKLLPLLGPAPPEGAFGGFPARRRLLVAALVHVLPVLSVLVVLLVGAVLMVAVWWGPMPLVQPVAISTM